MDRETRLPIAARLTSLTARDRLTRTGMPGKPTRAVGMTRPAKMFRLN